MVSEKDPDIVNPLARILIKPFHTKKGGWLASMARAVFRQRPGQIFVPDKTYGIHNDAFSATVKQFVEEKLNRGKEGKFQLAEGLYQDSVRSEYVRKNEETKPTFRW